MASTGWMRTGSRAIVIRMGRDAAGGAHAAEEARSSEREIERGPAAAGTAPAPYAALAFNAARLPRGRRKHGEGEAEPRLCEESRQAQCFRGTGNG